MPSFFELSGTTDRVRRNQVGDISDFTRMRRVIAESAPYINSRPKSGWNGLTNVTSARVLFQSIGFFRKQFPNAQ